MRAARTWPAAVTLFFAAGLIPESVATFNTPPLRLLTSPASLLFISAFYGSVALLVREFWRRTRAGWAAVLLLGMAGGAINEGIIAGTWYRVQYPGYALVGGIDPAVAAGLTVFHALVSAVLPILLVELAFPAAAGRAWLPRPALAGCCLLLAATAASGFAAPADRGLKLAVLAAVAAAVAIALSLPGNRGTAARPAPAPPAPAPPAPAPPAPAPPAPAPPVPARPVPGLARLRLAGAAATVAFYAIFALAAGLIAAAVPPRGRTGWQLLLVLLMAAYLAVLVRTGRRWTRRPGWGPQQTLAVITGALQPSILASLVLPAALRGLEPLITVPALAVLIWLQRRQRAGAGLVSAGPRPGPAGTGPPGGY